LNSLELAKQISGKKESSSEATSDKYLTDIGVDQIVGKLTNPASKYAAILLLCTKSKKAKQVLSSQIFGKLTQVEIATAFITLSTNKTIPTEPLAEETADQLLQKILDTFK
jgi:hypothetical protein